MKRRRIYEWRLPAKAVRLPIAVQALALSGPIDSRNESEREDIAFGLRRAH